MLNAVVDIYHAEEVSDWNRVAKAGIVGVIHKATQGLSYADPTYTVRRSAAGKAGLLWGAYHFATRADGAGQADHFLEVARPDEDTLIALDIETWKGGTVTATQVAQFIRRVVQKTGRYPWLYGSDVLIELLKTPVPEFSACLNWVARYSKVPPSIRWTLWQYTDGQAGNLPHEVPGIGPCDRNLFSGTVEELRKVWAFKPARVDPMHVVKDTVVRRIDKEVVDSFFPPTKETDPVINNFHPAIEQVFHFALDRFTQVVESIRARVPFGLGDNIAKHIEEQVGSHLNDAMKYAEDVSDKYFGKPDNSADAVARSQAFADKVRRLLPDAAKAFDAARNKNDRPENVV